MIEVERVANWLAGTGTSLAHQEAADLLRSQAAEIESLREQHAGAEFAVEKLKAEIESLREQVEMWKATANATVDFDAIRYRWLKENMTFVGLGTYRAPGGDLVSPMSRRWYHQTTDMQSNTLDELVDNAMKGANKC